MIQLKKIEIRDIDGIWYGTGKQFDDNSSWTIKLSIGLWRLQN
jgi:hypothetical protein